MLEIVAGSDEATDFGFVLKYLREGSLGSTLSDTLYRVSLERR